MAFIKQMVTECDFSYRTYDHPVEGAGAVAQGASGRWCVVMWAGPEYIEENNIEVVTPESLREKIESNGDGWCDF